MPWGRRKEEAMQATEAQQPAKRGKLSPHLQEIVDHDDHFYDDVYRAYSVDSTNTPYRYAGYANRIRTLLLSAHRYVAYTSDIGESFRPVAHPYLVRSAYGISWTYLIGDVAHEGYKAYLRNRHVLAPPCEAYKDSSDVTQQQIVLGMATGNIAGSLTSSDPPESELTPWPTAHVPLIEDYRMVMAKRAVFQSVASMGLPALTIHSVVKYSGRALKGSKTTFMRTWVPIGLGLAVVPFLPYVLDHPVDEAVDWLFRTCLRAYAGENAVSPLPRQSQAAGATGGHEEDATSLSHFHIKLQEAVNGTSDGNTNENVTWEEYKEGLQRAKEQRRLEREARGESGILAMLGFGPSRSKSKEKPE
ncbi:mitochondrial fission process 1 family protein [Aspergillus lucknowensis]|uniref:Mitochondrial fission process protein 1 n=1 Tax=Aspergillus lucknowensis TaxID=176173 RepID=A0ABR4LQQ8_9EURO